MRGAHWSTCMRTNTDWVIILTPLNSKLGTVTVWTCTSTYMYMYAHLHIHMGCRPASSANLPLQMQMDAELGRTRVRRIGSQNFWRRRDVSWQTSGNPSLSWEAWPNADARINELSISRSFDQSEKSFGVLELRQWVNFTQNEEKCLRHAWSCVTEK